MKLTLRMLDQQRIAFDWNGVHIASSTVDMFMPWVGPITNDLRGWQGLNYIVRYIEPVLEANGWEYL